jgi:hypothetical protein
MAAALLLSVTLAGMSSANRLGEPLTANSAAATTPIVRFLRDAMLLSLQHRFITISRLSTQARIDKACRSFSPTHKV